jgi:hypothetical protein
VVDSLDWQYSYSPPLLPKKAFCGVGCFSLVADIELSYRKKFRSLSLYHSHYRRTRRVITTSNVFKMPKRPAEAAVDGNQVYLKRQKITKSISAGPAEEIRSARQLRQLLAFDQDASRSKQGLQFLETPP